MKKFTLTVITVVYILLAIAVISILASEFLFKAQPKERFFEAPQVAQFVENVTIPETKTTPKFYPAPDFELVYVKGLVIDPMANLSSYMQAIQEAKALGANLITIALETQVSDKDALEFAGQPTFDWKPVAIAMINEAHRNGLQVELRLIAKRDTSRTPKNITQYAARTSVFFKGLGDFAQEYEVYMLTIYENIEDEYAFYNYKDRIGEFLPVFLGNATYFYKGKVGIGFSDNSLIDDKKTYDVSGFDYLILNSYPVYKKVPWGDYPQRVADLIGVGTKLANRHGVKTVILGGWGLNSNPTPPYYISVTVGQEQEKSAYENIKSKQMSKVDGVTVAYVTKAYGVRGRPAEEVARDWFSSA
ncbi:MAG TPA: hypothetical protein HA224_02490 [Nanoarchaeota archaeon]|nr:hypothetical protein [Nanoarchaeota archaeon]